MRNLTVLIKPSSSKCNLACNYCFYHDVSEHRMVKDNGFMSVDTMTNIIRKAFEAVSAGTIHFAFQGGEPTVIGLEFFTSFINNVNTLKKEHTVTYSIQTNGILLQDNWVQFFKEHNFLVGISLDGYKELHDTFRLDHKGLPTHSVVMKKIELLSQYNVDFNILTVVTKQLSKHAQKVFNYYVKHNFRFLQFIPCLDPFDETKGKYSLDSDTYYEFLKIIFDNWYKEFKEDNVISIRMFDNIVSMLLGFQPESCDMVGRCTIQFVIESDGTVYPCDFYVLDEQLLGNINDSSYEDLFNTKKATDFVEESIGFNDICKSCQWLRLCRGGCKRHNNDNNHNRYCETYKRFYEYSYSRFVEIAQIVKNRNSYFI